MFALIHWSPIDKRMNKSFSWSISNHKLLFLVRRDPMSHLSLRIHGIKMSIEELLSLSLIHIYMEVLDLLKLLLCLILVIFMRYKILADLHS